jgi:ABC-2 type transport system permease protein
MRRSLALLLRQYYLTRGSAARLLPLFVWVVIDMVLWGYITRYLNSLAASSVDFVPRLLGAVLLWDFFTRVMQGVTMAFFEDVWSRNFLNLFATPMSIGEYVAGLVTWSVLTSTFGLIVMLLLSTAVFGLSFVAYGAALIPFLIVLFVFGISLGVVACGLVLRFGPAAEWFVWPIPAILAPFASVFYPMSTLPVWMQWVAHVLPPSYVFEGLRAIVDGRPVPATLLAVSVALAVVELMMASWVFRMVFRRAVRSGLLARYSAETVA